MIVTEDDAVCSPAYLAFMNEALDYYEDNAHIWSIGGYTVPIKIPKEYFSDVLHLEVKQLCMGYMEKSLGKD